MISMSDDPADWAARTHRILAEPQPVWVRCSALYLPRPASFHGVPLYIRAHGIEVGAVVPGEIYGWYRLNIGGPYWGLCRFRVRSANRHLVLNLTQLVPADALSPRAAGDGPPRAQPLAPR